MNEYPTYIPMLLILDGNRCARKEQSLLFDMFEAFEWIGSSHKSGVFFIKKKTFFVHVCATCSELPYNIT